MLIFRCKPMLAFNFIITLILLIFGGYIISYKYLNRPVNISLPNNGVVNGYSNYSNGGQIAFLNSTIYYIDQSILGGGVRKITENTDKYICRKMDKLYAYKQKLFCIKSGNVYCLHDNKLTVILNDIQDFAIANDSIYFSKFGNNNLDLLLFRCDFNGDNIKLLAEKVCKLFVIDDTAYYINFSEQTGLKYDIMIIENELITKVSEFNLDSFVNEITACKDFIVFDANVFSIVDGRIVDNSSLNYVYSAEPVLIYKTALDNTLICRAYSVEVDDIWLQEGDNTQPQIGLWKIDMNNDTKTKISNDYKIKYFAVFDNDNVYYLKDNKIYQLRS